MLTVNNVTELFSPFNFIGQPSDNFIIAVPNVDIELEANQNSDDTQLKYQFTYSYLRESGDINSIGYWNIEGGPAETAAQNYRLDIETAFENILNPQDFYSVSFSDVANVSFSIDADLSDGPGDIAIMQVDGNERIFSRRGDETVRRQSILDTAHKNIRCASGSLV